MGEVKREAAAARTAAREADGRAGAARTAAREADGRAEAARAEATAANGRAEAARAEATAANGRAEAAARAAKKDRDTLETVRKARLSAEKRISDKRDEVWRPLLGAANTARTNAQEALTKTQETLTKTQETLEERTGEWNQVRVNFAALADVVQELGPNQRDFDAASGRAGFDGEETRILRNAVGLGVRGLER